MKVLKLLIEVLRGFMYDSIDTNGLTHEKTINISKRLDKLIELSYLPLKSNISEIL